MKAEIFRTLGITTGLIFVAFMSLLVWGVKTYNLDLATDIIMISILVFLMIVFFIFLKEHKK